MFEENYSEILKRFFVVKGMLGSICDEVRWERGLKYYWDRFRRVK